MAKKEPRIFWSFFKAIASTFFKNEPNATFFDNFSKAIALLFGQKWTSNFWSFFQGYNLNFLTNFGHFWPFFQGYSLTFWPKMAHFHHFSICYQALLFDQNLVIFEQNTKAIALLFGQNGSFSSLFNLQSKSINFNFGHFFTKAIALLFGQKWTSFSSLFNLQSKSTFWPKFGQIFEQNTKAIALLFGQKWTLIFITFQSASQNQSKFGHFWAKYQGYSLTFWPKFGSFFITFPICNQNHFNLTKNLVIFEQNTKAIALLFGQKWTLIFITFQSAISLNQFPKFGHFWAKYQGYSLTFWPKMTSSIIFHHFSKAIALLFDQNQSTRIQIWSFLSKIPRL